MSTSAEHLQRLVRLRALYEQDHEQGGEFSECIKECQRSLLEHVEMAPFWRIKTYCLLVGANEDWEKAEVRKLQDHQRTRPKRIC